MNRKQNNFGVIRLLAACMVIVGHMYALLGQEVPVCLWHPVQEVGVAVFFCIGGYLITKSWLSDPYIIRYMLKRCFRIFPALIFCVFVTVIVIGGCMTDLPLHKYFTDENTWSYLKNIVFVINHNLPGVFSDNPYPNVVNGSLWSLPVEFMMYLVIPLWTGMEGCWNGKKGGRFIFWMGSTLVAIFAGCACTAANWENSFSFILAGRRLGTVVQPILRVVPYEFAGCLVAVCGLEKHFNLQVSVLLLAAASCLAFTSGFAANLAAYILIPYVTLSFALIEKPLFAAANKLDISYGIYLFSFVIQQMLIQICIQRGVQLHANILLPLSLLLSFVAGYATQRMIERPAAGLLADIMDMQRQKAG